MAERTGYWGAAPNRWAEPAVGDSDPTGGRHAFDDEAALTPIFTTLRRSARPGHRPMDRRPHRDPVDHLGRDPQTAEIPIVPPLYAVGSAADVRGRWDGHRPVDAPVPSALETTMSWRLPTDFPQARVTAEPVPHPSVRAGLPDAPTPFVPEPYEVASSAGSRYEEQPYGAARHGLEPHGTGPHSAGPHSAGQYGAGEYGAGQYGAGPFGTGQYGAGRYDMARHPAEPHDAERYDMARYDPEPYDAGRYDVARYEEQPRDAWRHDVVHQGPGRYTGRHDDTRYDDEYLTGAPAARAPFVPAAYDPAGYDAAGYDAAGYDAPGYDGSGYEAAGYDGSRYDAGRVDAQRYGPVRHDPPRHEPAPFQQWHNVTPIARAHRDARPYDPLYDTGRHHRLAPAGW